MDQTNSNRHGTTLRDAQQSVITENLHNTGDINFAYHNYNTLTTDVSRIVDWLSQLSPLKFVNKQLENLEIARKAKGTGQWFLKEDEFRQWRDGDGLRTLWCHGIPGAGKTILTSIVVDHLVKKRGDNGTAACLYVYFDHGDQKRQDVKNLLPCLLSQLIIARGQVSNEANRIYHSCRANGTYPTQDDYLQVIAAEIKCLRRAFIVVDALDECKHEGGEFDVRDEFVVILKQLPSNSRLLFFSRPDESIRALVNPDANLNIVAKKEELAIYIKSRINTRNELKRLIADKDAATRHYYAKRPGRTVEAAATPFMDKVVSTVVKASDGMFLLARLHMDFLASKISIEDLEEGLSVLPATPDEVYELALQRIAAQGGQKHALALAALRWLAFAERPLTVDELLGCLVVDPLVDGTSPEMLKPKGPVSEETLTSTCAGLLIIEPQTRLVNLAHYTTKEYLEKNAPTIWKGTGTPQTLMAEACLLYLMQDAFQTAIELSDAEKEVRKQAYPFHSYAADHWGRHLATVKGDKERQQTTYKLARKFLYNAEAVNNAFKAMSEYRFSTEKDLSALHIAAYFGLDRLTKILVKRDFPINTATQRGETPLHWAVFYRHSSMVKTLLECGASTDLADHKGRTPIHRAVRHEDMGCLNALLNSKQINLDIEDKQQWTPLRLGASYGNFGIVAKLVNHGADIDAQDKDGFTAFEWAKRRGHGKVADFLLEHGANQGSEASTLINELFSACKNGQLRLVRRILEMTSVKGQGNGHVSKQTRTRTVDINAVDKNGCTPLRMAVEYEHGTVVWYLIQAGADVNKPDKDGWSPLHQAAAQKPGTRTRNPNTGVKRGSKDAPSSPALSTPNIAWLLLESGADISQANRPGWTPLHVAAFKGNASLVWLFLDRIRNNGNWENMVFPRNKHGETPLHMASRGGHTSTVALLLQQGANPLTEVLNNGRTALHCAIESSQPNIVRQLVGHTPDLIDLYDDEKATPLHYAAASGSLEIMRILAGYYPYTPVPTRPPPSSRTASMNPSNRLAKKPSVRFTPDTHTGSDHQHRDVNAQDLSGNTALHRAATSTHPHIVTFLIEQMGAEPNIVNQKRSTALHAAAGTGNVAVVESFLAFNTPPPRADTGRRRSTAATAEDYMEGARHVNEEAARGRDEWEWEADKHIDLNSGEVGQGHHNVVDTSLRDKDGYTAREILSLLRGGGG